MGQITVQTGSPPVRATVQFKDASGNVIPPDDVPRWESDNETAATVTPAEDGMSAEVTPGDAGPESVATAQITVTTTETRTGDEIISVGVVTVHNADIVVGEVTFEGATPSPPVPSPEQPRPDQSLPEPQPLPDQTLPGDLPQR